MRKQQREEPEPGPPAKKARSNKTTAARQSPCGEGREDNGFPEHVPGISDVARHPGDEEDTTAAGAQSVVDRSQGGSQGHPIPPSEGFDGAQSQKILNILSLKEDHFESTSRGTKNKLGLTLAQFQEMEEKHSPTEFPITTVRQWAQPLRFQHSITAKVCSPIAPSKRTKSSFSIPAVKERDWRFHVAFLNGTTAADTENGLCLLSQKFMKAGRDFFMHKFSIGEREKVSDQALFEEIDLDWCLEHLSTFLIIAHKKNRE